MNRRDFLRSLGLLTAAAATPKLIFDMGANSHLYTPKIQLMYREFTTSEYSIESIQAAREFEETFGKILENIYAREESFQRSPVSVPYYNLLESTYFDYSIDKLLVGCEKKYVLDI